MGEHQYFSQKIRYFQRNHAHNRRQTNTEQFTLPFSRFSKCLRPFLFTGYYLILELNSNFYDQKSLHKFKIELKKLLIHD